MVINIILGFNWGSYCNAGGGGAGAGSINVFYNTYFKKGTIHATGGASHSGSTGTSGNQYSGYTTVSATGGAGGDGCISCGSIASGSYVPDTP